MTLTAMKYVKVLWELRMPVEPVKEAARLYTEENTLRQVLLHPGISGAEKEAVIRRIFPKEIQGFLAVLCRHKEAGALAEIAHAYETYVNEHQDVLNARLLCVTPPNEAQEEGIRDFLKREFGVQQVDLQITRDSSLIGGFRLQAQGREYDRSIRGRLDEIRQELTQNRK